jgi:hypothetical protein
VNLGEEYLVLESTGSLEPCDVDLAAGRYTVEWFSVSARTTHTEDPVTVKSAGRTSFKSPFDGPAVLYLQER